MESEESASLYQVWGADGVVYGPVELPELIAWVKEERLTGDSWVYHVGYDRWQKASLLPELQIFFRNRAPEVPILVAGPAELKRPSEVGIQPKVLRRIRVFSTLSDEQLHKFMGYVEVFPVPQWKLVVKQGDPGDAMFLVLDGEVRVRLMIMSKETLLTTLTMGEFFGEVSLFDHGPRSADVVANKDSLLLRLSAVAFNKLAQEDPDLASPFLRSICKTLTGRIRADNKRFREAIRLMRVASVYNNL